MKTKTTKSGSGVPNMISRGQLRIVASLTSLAIASLLHGCAAAEDPTALTDATTTTSDSASSGSLLADRLAARLETNLVADGVDATAAADIASTSATAAVESATTTAAARLGRIAGKANSQALVESLDGRLAIIAAFPSAVIEVAIVATAEGTITEEQLEGSVTTNASGIVGETLSAEPDAEISIEDAMASATEGISNVIATNAASFTNVETMLSNVQTSTISAAATYLSADRLSTFSGVVTASVTASISIMPTAQQGPAMQAAMAASASAMSAYFPTDVLNAAITASTAAAASGSSALFEYAFAGISTAAVSSTNPDTFMSAALNFYGSMSTAPTEAQVASYSTSITASLNRVPPSAQDAASTTLATGLSTTYLSAVPAGMSSAASTALGAGAVANRTDLPSYMTSFMNTFSAASTDSTALAAFTNSTIANADVSIALSVTSAASTAIAYAPPTIISATYSSVYTQTQATCSSCLSYVSQGYQTGAATTGATYTYSPAPSSTPATTTITSAPTVQTSASPNVQASASAAPAPSPSASAQQQQQQPTVTVTGSLSFSGGTLAANSVINSVLCTTNSFCGGSQPTLSCNYTNTTANATTASSSCSANVGLTAGTYYLFFLAGGQQSSGTTVNVTSGQTSINGGNVTITFPQQQQQQPPSVTVTSTLTFTGGTLAANQVAEAALCSTNSACFGNSPTLACQATNQTANATSMNFSCSTNVNLNAGTYYLFFRAGGENSTGASMTITTGQTAINGGSVGITFPQQQQQAPQGPTVSFTMVLPNGATPNNGSVVNVMLCSTASNCPGSTQPSQVCNIGTLAASNSQTISCQLTSAISAGTIYFSIDQGVFTQGQAPALQSMSRGTSVNYSSGNIDLGTINMQANQGP